MCCGAVERVFAGDKGARVGTKLGSNLGAGKQEFAVGYNQIILAGVGINLRGDIVR